MSLWSSVRDNLEYAGTSALFQTTGVQLGASTPGGSVSRDAAQSLRTPPRLGQPVQAPAVDPGVRSMSIADHLRNPVVIAVLASIAGLGIFYLAAKRR